MTYNELFKKEIKETIPYTIAQKIIKYLIIIFFQEVKDLYSGNSQTLMKNIKEDTNKWNKWKDIQCPWVRALNIIKMSTLPKENYRYNAIPVRRGKAGKIIIFNLDHHWMLYVSDNDLVVRVKTDNSGEIQVLGRMS